RPLKRSARSSGAASSSEETTSSLPRPEQARKAQVEPAAHHPREAFRLGLADAQRGLEPSTGLAPERSARRGEAAGDRDAMNVELDGQRVQRETVGEVPPKDAPLLSVERSDRTVERLVERPAITLLLVVHLGVVHGRTVELAAVVAGGPGLPTQVHPDVERD